ncbi:hypothetical protein I4U23_011921 [Adineta vaga]|nr:hypothetical protein I4U23_011921 [Adineta vaga]
MTITASSDDSRSNGDEYSNGEGIHYLPEDGGSCTDSTSSSSNNHRRIVIEDQEYRGDFDNDDEDEDDWRPKKKKRRNPPINSNKKKKKKEDLIIISEPISELDFDNCIIPLDKLCPQIQHGTISFVPPDSSSSSSLNLARSPLNLVEDEQSSTASIILFQEDSKR